MFIPLIGLVVPLLTGSPSGQAKTPAKKPPIKRPAAKIDMTVPRYASSAVKTLVTRSLRRYENLNNVAYTSKSRTASSQVWISGGSIHEKQAGCEWMYSNGFLTIKDIRHGKTYRGKTKGNRIAGYLSQIGVMIEPTVQMALLKKNRVGTLVLPGFYVRSVGVVKVANVPCTAVQILGPTIKIDALIRQQDALLASVSSEALDRTGSSVAKADRQYAYSSVGKPLPASTFTIPLGGKKPLPLKSMPNQPKKIIYKIGQ